MNNTRIRPLFAIAALFAPLAFASAPIPAEVATLVASNNAFACDLYSQLKGREGNLFFSPFSVSSALAMTQAGARSETAAQMARALRFPSPQAELHPAFATLAERLNAVQTAGHVKLSIANSLWPHTGYPFLEDYLALVKKNYGTTITPVDYAHDEPKARAQINQWVEQKTQAKIKNLLASPLDPLTRLVLVNAVYFKGDWESKFKPEQTQNAPFLMAADRSIPAPLMTQTHKFKYGEWGNAQVIEIPYAGTELSMLVILPSGEMPPARKGTENILVAEAVANRRWQLLAEIEKGLSAERLALWRKQMHAREVRLFLPKFKVTWGVYSLKGPLEALGMRDAFDATNADFSGMDGRKDLCIADVLHKAFVDVNEEGTEAAAATAVVMRATGMPMPPPVFRADHPFIFLIQENATGSILFMGRVMDPTK